MAGSGTIGHGEHAPQPGVDQLTEPVEQIRSTGLPVDLSIEGTPPEMPAALQLAIYRIIQEALTNARNGKIAKRCRARPGTVKGEPPGEPLGRD
ncbi:hypothetical protein [Actinomadura macra]|uniref:hypothetical protein n=1 Tax=Actinomadura macra TaxID=46164 RepID=UPI00082F65C8|nr:hypothetical protein [Actinomadura macra]